MSSEGAIFACFSDSGRTDYAILRKVSIKISNKKVKLKRKCESSFYRCELAAVEKSVFGRASIQGPRWGLHSSEGFRSVPFPMVKS